MRCFEYTASAKSENPLMFVYSNILHETNVYLDTSQRQH